MLWSSNFMQLDLRFVCNGINKELNSKADGPL